jgi:uncharacterized protein
VIAQAMTELALTQQADAVRFSVHVKPRSSRSRVEGVRPDGALAIALKAPPVDGAANAELVEVLARALGVPKSAVRVVSGATGRRKLVEVAGVAAAAAREALV